MNNQELEEYLETRKKSMSETDYFDLILNMLQKNPTKEAKDILLPKLLTYSFIDGDRVANYLEPFLNDEDEFQREVTAFRLFLIPDKPNSLARKLLAKYLAKEPIEDSDLNLILDRFQKLILPKN